MIIRVWILLIISILISCTENKKTPETEDLFDESVKIHEDSIRVAKLIEEHDEFPEIKYERVYIENYKQLKEILTKYAYRKDNLHNHKAITTLNRKELRFFRIKDTIIVPDTIINDMRAYSLFPPYYDGASDIDKILIVSNKYQAYACYERGELVRFAACNTGKERTPTFPGRYSLVWKEKNRRSSLDSNWFMPYTWNFHSQAGNAFHQFQMPGRPVSHSCVRQFMSDAEWLYNWGRGYKYTSDGKPIHMSGTPVLIIDIFDFARKRYGPWLDLTSSKDQWIELPENPMEVEEALIPYCQIPDASKGALINRERFVYAEDTLRARGIIRDHVKLIETVNFNDKRRKEKVRLAKIESEKKKSEEAKRLAEEKRLTEEKLKEKYLKDKEPEQVFFGPSLPPDLKNNIEEESSPPNSRVN